MLESLYFSPNFDFTFDCYCYTVCIAGLMPIAYSQETCKSRLVQESVSFVRLHRYSVVTVRWPGGTSAWSGRPAVFLQLFVFDTVRWVIWTVKTASSSQEIDCEDRLEWPMLFWVEFKTILSLPLSRSKTQICMKNFCARSLRCKFLACVSLAWAKYNRAAYLQGGDDLHADTWNGFHPRIAAYWYATWT